jgi:hypothetical protein
MARSLARPSFSPENPGNRLISLARNNNGFHYSLSAVGR